MCSILSKALLDETINYDKEKCLIAFQTGEAEVLGKVFGKLVFKRHWIKAAPGAIGKSLTILFKSRAL